MSCLKLTVLRFEEPPIRVLLVSMVRSPSRPIVGSLPVRSVTVRVFVDLVPGGPATALRSVSVPTVAAVASGAAARPSAASVARSAFATRRAAFRLRARRIARGASFAAIARVLRSTVGSAAATVPGTAPALGAQPLARRLWPPRL